MSTPSIRTLPLLILLAAASVAGQAYEMTELRMSSTTTASARRGYSVAFVGDIDKDGRDEYAIGAPYEATSAGTNAGRVRVYNGRTGALIYTFHGNLAFHRLGYSVDGAGDFDGDGVPDIVAGGYGGSVGGVVKVFSGATGGTILQIQGFDNSGLGISVAGAGDTSGDGLSDIVYGLPYEDPNGLTNAGQARVSGLGMTTWLVNGNHANQRLGFSVDSCGDLGLDGLNEVVIGAPYYNIGFPNANIGRVQVFSPQAAIVAPIIDYIPNNGLIGNHWNAGYSVAGIGDTNGDGVPDIAVGCRGYGLGAASADGRVQIISGVPTLPATVLHTYDAPTGWAEQLGFRLQAAGDLNGDGITDILASAPNFTPASDRLGRVLALSGANLVLIDQWRGPSHNTDYGHGIGGGGDLNGDEIPDVIIGASRYDSPSASSGGQDQGRVWIYSGDGDFRNHLDSTGLVLGAHLTVAGIGDLNGDGFDEYAVGNPDKFSDGSDVGEVFVWNGADGSLLTIIPGSGGADSFGAAIDGSGDCNADGIPDIVIGAPEDGGGEGRAYIHSGADFSLLHTVAPFGVCTPIDFGAAVAGAGDVNGDGYDDVLVGDPTCVGLPNAGRFFLVSGLDGTQMTAVSGFTAELMGTSLDGIGDINGDGYADLAVGAPGSVSGDGRIDVWLGQASVPFISLMGSIWGNNGEGLGTSVAGAGDVDADGVSDIVAGAPYFTGGPLLQSLSQRGRVAVFSGTNLAQLYSRYGDDQFDHLGASVSGAGDFDGDGHADYVAGAPDGDSQGYLSNGYLYVCSGANGAVIHKVQGPRQANAKLGRSVARAGRVSNDPRDEVLTASRTWITFGNASMTHVISAGDFIGLDHFGLGTPWCDGPVLCTANGPPTVGNADFGYTCRNAPPVANATFLVTFSGFESTAGLDLTGHGILFHADFIASPPFAQFPMSSDITGYGTSPAPMPNIPTLAGFTATIQGVWFSNPNCAGPILGVSTTNGLNVTIQP